MASNPQYALRLTLAYQGARIRVAGSERVAMIAPAQNTAPPEAGSTGYWFGVLDAAGRVIYHRSLHSPIRIDVEAFSPDPRQTITRVPILEREGQFTVLMPDVPNAHAFVVHGPADPERPDEPARELLRLDVDALRRLKPPQGGGGSTSPQGGGGTTPPQGQKG